MNDEKDKLVEIDSKYYETEKKSDQDLDVAKINLKNEQEKIETAISQKEDNKIIATKNLNTANENVQKTERLVNQLMEKIWPIKKKQALEKLEDGQKLTFDEWMLTAK